MCGSPSSGGRFKRERLARLGVKECWDLHNLIAPELGRLVAQHCAFFPVQFLGSGSSYFSGLLSFDAKERLDALSKFLGGLASTMARAPFVKLTRIKSDHCRTRDNTR